MPFCTCEPEVKEPTTSIKPHKQRSCTDVLALLLFLAAWIATISLTSDAIANGGDPERVIRGVDYLGRICGKDTDVKDQELAAWVRPDEYDFKICVSSCSQTSSDARMAYKHTSKEFLFYCVPSLNGSVSISFSGDFESASESFSRAMGDLFTAWPVLLGSAGIALIFSFFYLNVVQKVASCLVWGVILFIVFGGAALGYSLMQSAEEKREEGIDEDRADLLYGIGAFFVGFSFIFAIVVFTMRTRIYLAVAVVKEASQAINDMKSMVLFPIGPFIFSLGYLTFWVIVALYIWSLAAKVDKTTPSSITSSSSSLAGVTTFSVYERDESYNNSLAFHFFGLLWNIQFLIYFCFMVLCGAVADWYFSDKPEKKLKKRSKKSAKVAPLRDARVPDSEAGVVAAWEQPQKRGLPLSKTPVRDSCRRTCRFHLGTVAFGALIIAIINFIRAAVMYIEEHCKNKESCLQRCMFCVIQCFLKCLHCCADKISKNAFIWTAIWGDSFVPAAVSSWNLIWANLARVAAVSFVGEFLMFLGKFMVAAATAGVCGLILTRHSKYQDELSSPVIPIIMCFIIAYAVASLFMVVYDTAIDAIFLCYLVDVHVNNGTAIMASPGLQKAIGQYAKASKQKAQEMYANAGYQPTKPISGPPK